MTPHSLCLLAGVLFTTIFLSQAAPPFNNGRQGQSQGQTPGHFQGQGQGLSQGQAQGNPREQGQNNKKEKKKTIQISLGGFRQGQPQRPTDPDPRPGKGQSKGPQNDTRVAPQPLWTPLDYRTADQWKSTHGRSTENMARHRQAVKECKMAILENMGVKVSADDVDDSEFLDDVLMSEGQALECVRLNKKSNKQGQSSRQKRTTLLFTQSNKWILPIKYKWDGHHTNEEQNIIRQAIQLWERETCIRFQEVSANEMVDGPHLLITKETSGCWSMVGVDDPAYQPQQVNLWENCVYEIGTPAHELGHAIGFWHEQSRGDRDDYVDIIWGNIFEGQEYNFRIEDNMDPASLDIPYDYSSIMHYSATGFSKIDSNNNHLQTILPKERIYTRALGQKTGLSFFDTKHANQAYCDHICPTKLPCERGGYTDPNDCYRCKCPEGFGGTYCERQADNDQGCYPQESLLYAFDYEQTLTSPYYNYGKYPYRYSCNWLIQAPEDCSVEVSFRGEFGLQCNWWNDACQHWVEIKYKQNLQLRGPRFCCRDLPTHVPRSESNQMLVMFRSDTPWEQETQRGFTLTYRSVCSGIRPTGTTTTTTTTTTTPSPPPPTTTKPTTTPTPTVPTTRPPFMLKHVCFPWSRSTGCQQYDWWGQQYCYYSRRIRFCYHNDGTCRWDIEHIECTTCPNGYGCCEDYNLDPILQMGPHDSCTKQDAVTQTGIDVGYYLWEYPSPSNWEPVPTPIY